MNEFVIKLKHTFLLVFSLMIIISCDLKKSDGPYFGNGFRNGWADQTSITIWTRLTKTPEMNSNGTPFIPITRKEHNRLAKLKDIERLHNSQIPQGLMLEDMEGACPGAFGEVNMIYFPQNNPENILETGWSSVDSSKNYTKQWKLKELESNTKYQVKIYSRHGNGFEVSDSIMGSFITPPKKNIKKDIGFSVVSCHDYNRRDSISGHKIYSAMAKDSLDFYVHTGDIEYYDKKNPWAFTEPLMRFKWDRIFALPLQRDFYTKTTSYFMKDDHDVLKNDAYPGMTYGPVSFERGLEIFDKEQFPSNDVTYKTVRWGEYLQVWLLEGRNYRSKNTDSDGPEKTILGVEQKKWLFETIESSDAKYKVIISASPILGPDRPVGKNDNHSNDSYQFEGQEIRDFINKYDNIFVCNGDRHWQYVTHFKSSNLWEFGCGAGTDEHAGGWKPNDVKPEHRFLRVKGGYLMGKVFIENSIAKLKFEHKDVNGKVVHTEIFER